MSTRRERCGKTPRRRRGIFRPVVIVEILRGAEGDVVYNADKIITGQRGQEAQFDETVLNTRVPDGRDAHGYLRTGEATWPQATVSE